LLAPREQLTPFPILGASDLKMFSLQCDLFDKNDAVPLQVKGRLNICQTIIAFGCKTGPLSLNLEQLASSPRAYSTLENQPLWSIVSLGDLV
jgi:hypothetical protein